MNVRLYCDERNYEIVKLNSAEGAPRSSLVHAQQSAWNQARQYQVSPTNGAGEGAGEAADQGAFTIP